MKLIKKLIPVATVGATLAGVVPTIASCGTSNDGWVDGTLGVDTTNFAKYDGEIDYHEGAKEANKLTKEYLTLAQENPQLIQDDFKYSVNQLYSVIEILPEYVKTDWADLMMDLLSLLENIMGQVEPQTDQAHNLDSEMTEIIRILLNIIGSPLKDVEVKTLKAKLDGFKVDDLKKFRVSYEQQTNIDLFADISFNNLPKTVLDLIYEILGITLDGTIEIKLNSDVAVVNCPVGLTEDIPAKAKKAMFDAIDHGGDYDNDTFYGFSLIPLFTNWEYLAFKEFLYKDKDWAINVNLDFDVIIKSNDVTINLFGDLPHSFVINHELMPEPIQPITASRRQKIVTLKQVVLFILNSCAGWSTYYYSDLMYENPLSFFNEGSN